MKNNIIIAGVPRAGKSTVSHILSQEYGYQHVSMDSIIAGLGKMYAGGGEFTENINKMGGEGTAEFTHRAIQIYCG